jgi:hypothetical protein
VAETCSKCVSNFDMANSGIANIDIVGVQFLCLPRTKLADDRQSRGDNDGT